MVDECFEENEEDYCAFVGVNVSAEKAMLRAILVRAAYDALVMRCAQNWTRKRQEKEQRKAQDYFGLNHDEPNLTESECRTGFTFADLCHRLDLCPHYIHGRLKKLMGLKKVVCSTGYISFFEKLGEDQSPTYSLGGRIKYKFHRS
jgi:hypothetical protein